MDYWDNTLLGYDLAACLAYNPQEPLSPQDIKEVLAVWEGENDGDDWRWVVRLDSGKYAFIQGGCDYTGWDCQSYAISRITDTAEYAAAFARSEDADTAAWYSRDPNIVFEDLMAQLGAGKRTTWREAKDEELGVTSGAPMGIDF